MRCCLIDEVCTLFCPVRSTSSQYDQELGEAIEIEYLRFVPFMNKALARLVQEEHPQYANDAEDQVGKCHLLSGTARNNKHGEYFEFTASN